MTVKTAKPMVHPTQKQLKLLLSVSCGMFLLLMETDVQADALKDPTQPPASLSSEATNENGQNAGPTLQSVMIGPQYSAAIISGKKVMLGGKYENSTLIRINEREVVLRNSDKTTQTLAMDYAVIKKTKPAVQTNNKQKINKH
jgi:MSHA biogenesis protein MshK